MNDHTKTVRLSAGNSGLCVLFGLLIGAVLPALGQDATQQPNYVEETVYDVDGSGTNNVHTVTFSDGLGRKLQSQTLINGTTRVLISGLGYNGYDNCGRPERTLKPFTHENYGQLTFITGDLYSLANAYHSDDAFSSKQFYDEPLDRIKAAGAPGAAFSVTVNPEKTWYFGAAPTAVQYFSYPGFLKAEYFSKAQKGIPAEDEIKTYVDNLALANPDVITGNLTITMDANGNFTQVLKDGSGNITATWALANSVQNEMVSRKYYDVSNRLVQEEPPATGTDQVNPTTYTYNLLGQLVGKSSPDEGWAYNYYDAAGRLYEVIDANLSDGNTVANSQSPRLRYGYDVLGRNTTISRYEPSDGRLCTWTRSIYDDPEAARAFLAGSNFPADQNLDDILNGLSNTRGRIVAAIAYDQAFYAQRAGAGEIEAEEIAYRGKVIDLFSYDEEGRVIRKYKSIPGIPLQLIKFGYNLQGMIKADTIEFSDGAVTHIYTQYIYNPRGQLWRIVRNNKEFVRYTYDETGRKTAKTFLYGTANARTVSYTYNIRDWTKTITADDNSFSEEICYETNDLGTVAGFTFTPQYNGNISRARSHVAAGVNGADLDLFYAYDNISRLTQVSNNKSYANKADYEGIFSYYNDGRILKKNEGTDQQAWGDYLYYSGGGGFPTNKLKSIPGSGKGDNALANFIYDYNGNMVLDRSKKMAVEYDWRDMPVVFSFFSSIGNEITTFEQVKTFCATSVPVSKVSMLYDASGNRVKKATGTVAAAADKDLIIANTANSSMLSATRAGYLLSNRPFADMSSPIPDGALIAQNPSGEMVAMGAVSLQMLGTLLENSGAPVENADLVACYSTTGVPSDPPQLAVNNHGSGIVTSGAKPTGLVVTDGVGYVDNSHVFVKKGETAPYELSYVNAAEGVSLSDNTFEYYLEDHLGSTRAVMKEGIGSWQMQEAMSYLAYGAIKILKQSPEDGARQKFTGKEFDEDGADEASGVLGIKLDYFGKRYYDAEIGRWVSTDPDEQFDDLYAYAGNGTNPINFADDDGGNIYSKAAKVGIKLLKTGDAASAFADNIQDAATLVNPAATPMQKVVAAVSLASEFAPVSVGDIKDGVKVGRVATSKLRKAWEKYFKKDWPKDQKTGRNMDAAHRKALADGGTNHPTNVEPLPHDVHMQQHKESGDFKRWGARRNKTE